MNPSEVKDFYERLGVSKTASERWHPDHNPGRESESRIEFIAVSEAYQSISPIEKPGSEQQTEKHDYEFYNSFYQDFLRAVEEVPPELAAATRLFSGSSMPPGFADIFRSFYGRK